VLGELTEAAAPRAPGFPASYILAVGSLLPRKAYDVLIEAARLVRERGVPLDVVLVGDGPEAPRLASLAAAAGLADHVFFAGEMAQDEALRFYPRARFFVHTARQEAFGLVLLEAMSFGKAVIATRVGGIPEFVRDGETGLLVEPDDPEALAQAMMRLSNDPAFRETLGARGREVATKEHSWERVVDAYCEAYRTVLG
jgi:glycosyltransferase involved in cell wall biosynthesis